MEEPKYPIVDFIHTMIAYIPPERKFYHGFENEINVSEKPEWTLIPNLNKDSRRLLPLQESISPLTRYSHLQTHSPLGTCFCKKRRP
jgi:hypothetical protein